MKITEKIFEALCITMSVLGFSSCDEHEEVDYHIYIGYILCDDHRTMSVNQYESQNAVNAVGVVFAEQTEDHPALAVMLDELSSVAFADTVGFSQGTSGSLESFDGWENTVALHNSQDARSGKGSPLANEVFHYHKFGQSDYVPSVAEMRLLIAALPQVNPIIEYCGGTPLSLDSEAGSCWYWSSTEVSEDKANSAWLCSSVNGGIMPTLKDEPHSARAIVALYY